MRNPFSLVPVFLALTLSLISVPVYSENEDCPAAIAKWEQAYQELRNKLQEFGTIAQTPVDRIVQRPLIQTGNDKTIAGQVAEALGVKENLLTEKRKECRTLMNLENQIFNDIQECVQNAKGSKDKDFKNFTKKRQTLLEKAVLALAEVKEVEGKETALSYADPYRDPNDPNRSANNYWQSYQQMYRRWWGH
jgi:hypothetical protein